MEIEEAKRAVQLRQWAEMIQECRNSGQTVRVWCEANSINIKTYYYRLKRVRLAALKSTASDIQALPSKAKPYPAFAELTLTDSNMAEPYVKDACTSAVTIHAGQMTICIHNEAGPDIISNVIKAVKGIC